jgi:hypothetical protein
MNLYPTPTSFISVSHPSETPLTALLMSVRNRPQAARCLRAFGSTTATLRKEDGEEAEGEGEEDEGGRPVETRRKGGVARVCDPFGPVTVMDSGERENVTAGGRGMGAFPMCEDAGRLVWNAATREEGPAARMASVGRRRAAAIEGQFNCWRRSR